MEGGPLTSLSFLEQRLVDRVILIRAPVAFRSSVYMLYEYKSTNTDAEDLKNRQRTTCALKPRGLAHPECGSFILVLRFS